MTDDEVPVAIHTGNVQQALAALNITVPLDDLVEVTIDRRSVTVTRLRREGNIPVAAGKDFATAKHVIAVRRNPESIMTERSVTLGTVHNERGRRFDDLYAGTGSPGSVSLRDMMEEIGALRARVAELAPDVRRLRRQFL